MSKLPISLPWPTLVKYLEQLRTGAHPMGPLCSSSVKSKPDYKIAHDLCPLVTGLYANLLDIVEHV